MSSKLYITIPKPCHENWKNMTPVEQGRFCSVCSKNVYDFTKLSDDKIVQIFSDENVSCGKFSDSQLNRQIGNNNKSSLWLACTAAIMSFFVEGSHKANAQATPELYENNIQESRFTGKVDNSAGANRRISGIVSDFVGGLPGAKVLNLRTGDEELTDLDGKFSVAANECDSVKISFVGYKTVYIEVSELEFYNIQFKEEGMDDVVIDRYGGIEVSKPTFFGRLLRSVGNLFR